MEASSISWYRLRPLENSEGSESLFNELSLFVNILPTLVDGQPGQGDVEDMKTMCERYGSVYLLMISMRH